MLARESEREIKVYERIVDAYTEVLEEIGDFSEEDFKHCQMSKTRHRPCLPSPLRHLPRCFEQPSPCRRKEIDHEPPRCHCDRKVAKRLAFAAESARRQQHWEKKLPKQSNRERGCGSNSVTMRALLL